MVSNLGLAVPAGILSGSLSVTPEWLGLAATLVSEAVPIEAGGTLNDDGLEADVLSLAELDVEDLGLVDPIRFITLETDFFLFPVPVTAPARLERLGMVELGEILS